ncbi:Calcineurin-like phosphoesterase [Chitinophaga sp. YR627]|uniref:metallophosphoesterase n=1 Tax=Chitinophaga sp. YR627 TaxID=1881041 RepID=UPI0008EF7BF6|nr:metallophosphoesterase [Chitinophaga sp. YR627]SFN20118.1 Calcineurin-like phosphoesterase [Chitinophaga sp. YR627]
MKKLLRNLIIRLSRRFSSNPDKKLIFESLSQLYKQIEEGKKDKGLVLTYDYQQASIIVFSDQHKGGRDGSDDFMLAETSYLTALRYYYEKGFTLINLGDCEELWENKPSKVLEKNRTALLEEALFLQQQRYYRIFGNHDLEWNYQIPRDQFLKPIFGKELKVYEGLALKMKYKSADETIFLAHGHQGDKRADGNAFSKWFVAAIWTPIQRWLNIRLDTVSDSFDLVDQHNITMYEWSQQYKKTILISGHTHKPVFASMDHIDRLTKALEKAMQAGDQEKAKALQESLEKRRAEYAGKEFVKTMVSPSYFNTGCCCFSDGDITGIEITEGVIRLVKWDQEGKNVNRIVLEEAQLDYLFDQL